MTYHPDWVTKPKKDEKEEIKIGDEIIVEDILDNFEEKNLKKIVDSYKNRDEDDLIENI